MLEMEDYVYCCDQAWPVFYPMPQKELYLHLHILQNAVHNYVTNICRLTKMLGVFNQICKSVIGFADILNLMELL